MSYEANEQAVELTAGGNVAAHRQDDVGLPPRPPATRIDAATVLEAPNFAARDEALQQGPRARSMERSRSEELHLSHLPQCPAGFGLSRSSSCSYFLVSEGPEDSTATNHGDDREQQLSPLSTLLSGRGFVRDDPADDEESVSSVAYFDQTDLNPTNWMKAMDAYTFGFAIVALTTAVTHPILFFAGALTAFGTARAAGASYDFCTKVDGPVSRCLCFNGSLAGIVEEEEALKVEVTAVNSKCDSDEGTEEPSLSTDGEQEEPHGDHHAVASVGPFSPVGDLTNESWLAQHYPKLSHLLVQDSVFVGLSVVEFFKVFFDDDAPYNFLEFQKMRGDVDVQYGQWKDLPTKGTLSLHPSNTDPFPSDIDPLSYKERLITFKAKTNSFFGPQYASTTKWQRILIASKRFAVLESKTVLKDIPFCDRFFVMERWVIRAVKEDDVYVARLTSTCEPIFTSECAFEGQIRTKSCSSLSDVMIAWCAMARKALKLAEQAKLIRLGHSMNSFDCDEEPEEESPERSETYAEEPIEVEHVPVIDNETGNETLQRSGSEPEIPRKRLVGLRRSISQLGRRRASTIDGRLSFRRKSTTAW